MIREEYYENSPQSKPSRRRSKQEKRRKKSNRGDSRYVYKSVATVMLPGFSVGTLMGWEHVSTMKNDSNIVSVPFLYLGAIIGALIASCVMDRHGRHVCLWAFFWFLYLALLVRCLTGDITLTCIIRVVSGVSVGAYYQVVPIYIAELSHRRHRGILLAALGCFIALGIIASPMSHEASLLLVVDVVFGVAYFITKWFYAPETPYYDIANGNVLDAKRTLHRCRNADQWSGEIREITLDFAAYPRDVAHCLSFVLSFTEFNADFLHRTVTGAGLLLFSQAVFVTCHLGVNRYFYNSWEESEIVWFQVLTVLLAFIVNVFVIDTYGRKILLLISTGGVTLSYLVLFILFCTYDNENNPVGIIIMNRLVMTLFFYLGLDFIPIVYMCEIMPYPIRTAAVAFFLTLYFIAKCTMPVAHFYAYIFMDNPMPSLVYFFMALASVFFCWFIPPETKRLSLCAVQIKMDHDVTVFEDHLDLD